MGFCRIVWEQFELVALVFKPLQRFRQGCPELVDALERVVEGDDGTVAGITLHVVYHIISRQPFGVISGDEVPHHYTVVLFHPPVDGMAQPAVWRAEVRALEQRIGFGDIDGVGQRPVSERTQVMIGVIARFVTSAEHLFVQFRIFPHIVGNHEEHGLGSESVENVEDKRGGFGYRPVVECEVDRMVLSVHAPQGVWIEEAKPAGGSFDNHDDGRGEE